MNPAEFANIARTEQTLWWYCGMEAIFYRFLKPFIATRSIDRVLEAGCGTGHMSRSMQQHLGWKMFPSDLSAVGLLHARGMGLDRLTQLDLRTLPFQSTSFDAVISLDVIAHLAPGDDEAAFREFARVLKPGALLCVRTSALDILRSRHSMFVGERQRYNAAKLQRLCAAAGLRILRITYLNTLLLPIALMKFRVWEPLTNAPPSSGVAPVSPWLNRLLEIPLWMEQSLVSAGVNLPLGQSILLAAERGS